MPIQSLRRRHGTASLLAAGVLALCGVATIPGLALAQQEGAEGTDNVAVAEQKASQAFEAFEANRYAEAVALYLEAHKAAPNADMIYNVARIYDTKLGDRELAINFYRRYIADPGAVADRIQIANERLALLREAELAAARPAPAADATQTGAPGAAQVFLLPSAPPEPGWTGAEIAGLVVGITGIAAIGVGAGFGISAMAEARTARDLCDGNVCREQRGVDAAHRASDHALISTIGFVSGGVLTALGATLYLWPRGEPETAAAGAGDIELAGGFSAEGDAWSLELSGTW